MPALASRSGSIGSAVTTFSSGRCWVCSDSLATCKRSTSLSSGSFSERISPPRSVTSGSAPPTVSFTSKRSCNCTARSAIGRLAASVAIVNFDAPPNPSRVGNTTASTMITSVSPEETWNDRSRTRSVSSRRATSRMITGWPRGSAPPASAARPPRARRCAPARAARPPSRTRRGGRWR